MSIGYAVIEVFLRLDDADRVLPLHATSYLLDFFLPCRKDKFLTCIHLPCQTDQDPMVKTIAEIDGLSERKEMIRSMTLLLKNEFSARGPVVHFLFVILRQVTLQS